MDWDELAESSHYTESLSWARKFNHVRGSPLAAWVSTFRNNQPSEVISDYSGSFNWSCKIRFDDNVQWMVRFAVPGRVMKGDEKIRHEVATMQFVKEKKTNISVPSIMAWGLSHDNPLGLGAFIMMEFIDGIPLDMILQQSSRPGDHPSTSILRPDISSGLNLDVIYRQIANILLDLSAHDFPRIGSLSSMTNGSSNSSIDSPPLTLKMNEIESHGGVCVGSQASEGFSSATEYFRHVVGQDLEHLRRQPNSIDDGEDARRKYLHNHVFNSIVPDFVDERCDRGPFKLVCDDFRFGNILVDNARDLKIVAVLDWEWSYAAPFQMLYSPPRWLLFKKPSDWDAEDLHRYDMLLKVFIKILREEENKRAESLLPVPTRMATVMQESMEDGKFWFHELIYSCFESPDCQAWVALRESPSLYS